MTLQVRRQMERHTRPCSQSGLPVVNFVGPVWQRHRARPAELTAGTLLAARRVERGAGAPPLAPDVDPDAGAAWRMAGALRALASGDRLDHRLRLALGRAGG